VVSNCTGREHRSSPIKGVLVIRRREKVEIFLRQISSSSFQRVLTETMKISAVSKAYAAAIQSASLLE
jgi:transcriptional regulator of NAD metabolism